MVPDAEKTATPVPRHTLLISDNPPTAPPRVVVTARDGTATVRLRPGNYTVESDKPVVFHGKTYQWTQTIDVGAQGETVLDLTASNADVQSDATGTPGASPAVDADPSSILMQWQDSVVALWTPTARASGFVFDGGGLIATSQRAVGDGDSHRSAAHPGGEGRGHDSDRRRGPRRRHPVGGRQGGSGGEAGAAAMRGRGEVLRRQRPAHLRGRRADPPAEGSGVGAGDGRRRAHHPRRPGAGGRQRGWAGLYPGRRAGRDDVGARSESRAHPRSGARDPHRGRL